MLDQTRPYFLTLLDEDPNQAFRAFYTFACKLLSLKPPRSLRALSDAESKDLIHDIILHCVRDNFKVLRSYNECGKSFAGWLYIVAHNKGLDYLRTRKREMDVMPPIDNPEESNLGRRPVNPNDSIMHRTIVADVIDKANECLAKLGQYCQLLIQMAADEYTPREMVLVLGWPTDKNKKVSDDLRSCRQQLKNLLVGKGVSLEAVFKT
jgi:DNA-directed RNA polymerase specialized sigma24 family protein